MQKFQPKLLHKENMSQKTIYVSNLAYETKENDLESHFNQFGNIDDIKLITDRDTGRSRGFAFIEFASQAAAEKAIKEGNNSLLMSRTVRVSIARDKRQIKAYILASTIGKILEICFFTGLSVFFFCGNKLISQLNEQSDNIGVVENTVNKLDIPQDMDEISSKNINWI